MTVTVVTDCTRQELSQKWDIPIGKIVENRRVRVSEHLVFVVKDKQLLKGKNFGAKTPKISTGGKNKAKIKAETMSESRENYHVGIQVLKDFVVTLICWTTPRLLVILSQMPISSIRHSAGAANRKYIHNLPKQKGTR